MEDISNAFKIKIGKPTSRMPLEKRKRSWEDSITGRMNLAEVKIERMDWIQLMEDRKQ